MKRTLATAAFFLLLISLVSTTAMAHSCVDKNRDYWCDDCGMLIYHTCVDANKDTWCDKCSCWIPHDCYDKNGDGDCDQCGKIMDVKVRIHVSSHLSTDQNVLLVFYEGNYPSVNASLYGLDAEHTFNCAANNRFQLLVTKYGHPSRTYSYNTKTSDIYIDAALYPYGDVSQDGKVNVGDVARIYGWVKSSEVPNDDYTFECADVSGDGRLNIGDVAKVYSHIRGTSPLW